jgi:hypothetical protein
MAVLRIPEKVVLIRQKEQKGLWHIRARMFFQIENAVCKQMWDPYLNETTTLEKVEPDEICPYCLGILEAHPNPQPQMELEEFVETYWKIDQQVRSQLPTVSPPYSASLANPQPTKSPLTMTDETLAAMTQAQLGQMTIVQWRQLDSNQQTFVLLRLHR